MGEFWRHLRILLWKNALIKWRTPMTTITEIVLPVLITLVLVALRSAVSNTDVAQSLRLNESSLFDPSNGVQFLATYPSGKNIDNPCSFKIAFTPSPAVAPIAQSFQNIYPQLTNCIIFFNTSDQVYDYLKGDDYGRDGNPYISTVVEFDSIGFADNNWDYSIWANSSATSFDFQTSILPDTQQQDPVNLLQWTYEDTFWPKYLNFSIILIQDFVETYVLQTAITGNQIIQPSDWPTRTITANPMPTPEYIDDSFADIIQGFIGLLFTIVFLLPVTRVIKLIVEEKELRIREGMKMMGLSSTALWLSWLITYIIIYFITTILIVAITANNIFQYSNKGLIFIFFFLFQLTTFSFSFMFSTFFSTARLASTFGSLIFLVSFFPYYAVQSKTTATSKKTAACLSSPICFSLGAVNIIQREGAEVGIQTDNASSDYYNFSFSSAIGMMLLDFFLYLFVGLYLDAVVPGQWGTPLPWYFLFTKNYWFPRKHAPLASTDATSDAVSHPMYEPVAVDESDERKLGVAIRRLRKEFKTDEPEPFVAVNDVSMDMYTGQIFALLGHNGSGKSTSINMLTGMLSPTSGYANIFGYNILHEMPQIRKILGVCPQHNVLFNLLTVKEHLQLFAALKGIPSKEADGLVMDMIKQVGLEEKVNVKSAALSGGMQRKLSVGIALIGDSKIVFLDEPTSGMDPYSRRATWDLLKKKKEGRVIILTTHFMDEADQLGDRVAILAHGDIQCCGSPLFLKNKYGVGYTLTLVKLPGFDEDAVHQCIQQHVPDAESLSNIAAEISFRLPLHASSAFADMFDALDTNKKVWSIDTYSVSVTTLEEVFLRVSTDAKEHPVQAENDKQGNNVSVNNNHGSESRTVYVQPAVKPAKSPLSSSVVDMPPDTPRTEAYTHVVFDKSRMWNTLIYALLVKRWCNAKRNTKAWAWTAIIPFVVLLLFIGILKIANDTTHPSVPMNYGEFNQPLPYPLSAQSTYTGLMFPPFENSVVGTVNLTTANLDQLAFLVDVLPNSTSTDPITFANFLWDSWPSREESVYGGLLYATTIANNNDPLWTDTVNVFFNTSGLYTLPLFFHSYNEALLKNIKGDSASISLTLVPFPTTKNLEALMNSLYAIAIGIAFAFVPASFIHYAVKEKSVKSKHQQMISGVDPITYWFSNFIWDYFNYIIPCILLIIVLYIYGIDELVNGNIDVTIVALLIFGFSVIPCVYLISFLFESHTSAQNFTLLGFIILGAFLPVASVILDSISSTHDINSHLKFVYRLAPPFCIIEIFTNLLVMGSSTIFPSQTGRWSFDVAGYPMIYMAVEGFVYMILVLAIEYITASPYLFSMFTKQANMPKRTFDDEDVDVVSERERLLATSGPIPGENITIRGLRKVYPGRLGSGAKTAVHNLYLGIPDGECFGFLGINGAGKCWGYGTKMMLFDGRVKEVQDIVAGDVLMGDDNTPRVVQPYSIRRGNTAFDGAKAATYRIDSMSSGRYSWTCNSDHILVLTWNIAPSKVHKLAMQGRQSNPWQFNVIEHAKTQYGRTVVNKLYSYPTQDAAERARSDLYATWQPLIAELTVDEFLGCSEYIRRNARMYQPSNVQFAPPTMSLQSRISKLVHRPVTLDETAETAWVLGVWLAHGTTTSIGIALFSDSNVVSRLVRWINKFDSACDLKNEDIKNNHIVLGNVMIELLQSYDLMNRQQFPTELLCEFEPIRRSLLMGVVDSHGKHDKRRFDILANQREFIEGLVRLSRSLGYSAGAVTMKLVDFNDSVTETLPTNWGVEITECDALQSKNRSASQGGDGFNVTKIEHCDYFGFTLDGNGRCLLGDFIVTHNTTTMKMLTNDIYPTEGDAYLAGMNVLSQQQEVRNKIGYCPQFDALIGTLTAREHLTLFARIKGVKEETIANYVEVLIEKLGLQEGIADRPCKGYSGGNKRKLCVGIALIGNPPIVFLDEPTTGVDPLSRRFMWNLIASTMKGRSVILTTHSMEESEALCQRIGVMVSGRLRCLGTASQLKSRYGNGWQLDINIPGREFNDTFVQSLMQEYQNEPVIIERHDQAQKWRIPKVLSNGTPVAISGMFRFIERMKEIMPIKEYSVSETTLEQIFIHFARQQEEETGNVEGFVVAQPDGSIAFNPHAVVPGEYPVKNGDAILNGNGHHV